MIFQLAKTSVGLTGQISWDFVVDNQSITNLYINPLYGEGKRFKYSALRDTHSHNIKRQFKNTNSFFKSQADNTLVDDILVNNKGRRIDTHVNTYEMGMKRCNFSLLNKQFSFFCPVFCDSKEEISNIRFKVVIKSIDDKDIYSCFINDDIIKPYIDQYIKDVDLDNQMLYIDLVDKKSFIRGLNTKSGLLEICNLNLLVDEIISKEYTLLEFDNILLRQFANNNIIATQVFNFNFLFNIYDIIDARLKDELIGQPLNVYIDVYCGDEKVGVRDLYSNYEFIPVWDIYSNSYSKLNVLDYKYDYTVVDLINTNKKIQSTFHWCCGGNNDYVFNLYNGFSPTDSTVKDYKHVQYSGVNGDTVVFANEYDSSNNPLGWMDINIVKDTNPMDCAISLYMQLLDSKMYSLPLKGKSEWIRGVQYDEYTCIDNSKTFSKYDIEFGLTVCPRMDNINRGSLYDILSNILKIGDNKPNIIYRKDIDDRITFTTRLNDTERVKDILHDDRIWILEFNCSESSNIHTYNTKKPVELVGLVYKKDNTFRILFVIFDYSDIDNYLGVRKESNKYFTYNQYFYIKSVLERKLQKLTNRVIVQDINTDRVGLYNTSMLMLNISELFKSFNNRLVKKLENIKPQRRVLLNKSIYNRIIDSPENKNYDNRKRETEIVLFKDLNILYRYDGLIYPCFIDVDRKDRRFNYIYYNRQYNKNLNNEYRSDAYIKEYRDSLKNKYPSVYPSKHLTSYKRGVYNYDKYYHTHRYYGEVSWFKKNRLYNLPDYIESTAILEQAPSEKFLKKLLKKHLDKIVNYYNCPNNSLKAFVFYNYIFDLYDITYTVDYINNRDIKNQRYKIKYTLR